MKKLLLSLLLISGLCFAGGPVQSGGGTTYTIATPITVQSANVGTTTASLAGQIRTPGLLIGADGSVTTVGTGTGSVVGNARGVGAVDTQNSRSAATMVAAGAYTGVFSGTDNTVGPLASRSAILSGHGNTISTGTCNIIGGGTANQITGGNYGFIGGGQTNVISSTGSWDSIIGGQDITISGVSAYHVAGGYGHNMTAGAQSTAFGNGHTMGGYYQFAGGSGHIITSTAGTAFGQQAKVDKVNQFAFGDSGFVNAGYAQWSNLIATRVATDSNPTRLGAGGLEAQRWTIASGSCWTGDCVVSAVASDSARSVIGARIHFMAKRVMNTVSVLNNSIEYYQDPTSTLLATSTVRLVNDDTNGAIYLEFVNGSTSNVRVTAKISQVETVWP